MDFLELSIIFIIIGYLIAIFLVLISDCDLRLAFSDKFGRKIAQLYGKVIWITGASTGIGECCALEAARLGAKIVLTARSEELLKQVKRKCLEEGKYHGLGDQDILILPMDMTKFDKHPDAVKKVLEHFGRIDVMLHNAGRSQRGRWEHIDLQVDKDMFDLNVFSVVNLSRLIVPHFKERGEGQFVLVSSVAGKFGVPFSASYVGSKHAINGYFEGLRAECLGTGIKVNIMCPGPVFSNLLSVAATEEDGKSLGESMKMTDRRMTTARCARLILVGTAHNHDECWIAKFPILPIMYAKQCFPELSKWVVKFLGPKFITRLRDSRDDLVKSN